MSVETLCLPLEDSDRLKKVSPFLKPTAGSVFGNPMESVKTPSLDQVISRSEIGATIIKNPLVVELKTTPQVTNPEPVVTLEPITSAKSESPKQEKYVDGPIFAFGVGAYRRLYNRYLEVSNGDMELAKKYTRMAIIYDTTSFIQEYYADAKDSSGRYIIRNHVARAELSHTPTKNEYIIKKNKAGKAIICSPEQEPLDVSITEFVSSFRRGADLAMINLVQEITTPLPGGEEGEITQELVWGSPPSEDCEGYWINKYCRKFGYIFKGSRVNEGGKEKLVVYSYKVDSKTAAHLGFIQDLGGQTFQASYESLKDEHKDENGQPREIDVALRTLVMLDGPLRDEEVISRAFGAKEKTERSKLMFDLDEETMKRANNPFLREQIEKNVSSQVADWLVDKIMWDISDEEIQPMMGSVFTQALRDFFGDAEPEDQTQSLVYQGNLAVVGPKYTPRESLGTDIMYAEALRRRQEVGGGFCGDLISQSTGILGGSTIIKSSNVINLVSRSGGFAKAGGTSLSVEYEKCSTCNLELCEGKCYNCEKSSQQDEKAQQQEEEY